MVKAYEFVSKGVPPNNARDCGKSILENSFDFHIWPRLNDFDGGKVFWSQKSSSNKQIKTFYTVSRCNGSAFGGPLSYVVESVE